MKPHPMLWYELLRMKIGEWIDYRDVSIHRLYHAAKLNGYRVSVTKTNDGALRITRNG